METKIKILLLGNNPNHFGLLACELKKSGLDFTLEAVQTEQQFEKALGRIRPDILLADYPLADFDELAAFRIRQNFSPQTPFIIVSGAIGEENAVELIKMGVTDFVPKEKLFQLAPKIHRALKEAADRKQKEAAQRQLRLREKQLSKILDLSLDVICTLDQVGRFVTISAAAKIAWGYLPQQLIGRKALDLVDEADRERTNQAIADLKHGRDMVNFENRFIRKDGSVVSLFWTIHWDPKERMAYGVARDATDIKKAEEKIKYNEKRFRTLLQNSSDGFSLIAADGRVLERSPAGIKILEYEIQEKPGRLRLDLVHPDDRSSFQQAWNQVRETPNGLRTIEYRLLTPDGSYKWIEVTFHNQLREPAIAAIILNYRDITKKKIAEIALRTSEARLNQAQAIGHMGSWEMNWADKSIIWSDEMYRMMGADKQDVTPSLEASAAFVHPDDREAFFNRFAAISVTLESGSMLLRIIRSDGELRYVIMAWRFEFDEEARPTCLFGIMQDITEQKLAELALEESEEKYRNLFNVSPTPMWVYDVETLRFLDVNEAAIKHYGYSKEEFLSMTLQDIRPWEEVEKLLTVAQIPKKATTQYSTIFKHKKKNGEVIDVDIKASLFELAGRKARLVIATDMSERMKYVQAIKEQYVKLREIAWIQSHLVRAPLARMMGLISMLENTPPEEDSASDLYSTADVLNLIAASAHELDEIIHEIVRKSEQVQDQPLWEERLNKF